MHENNHIYSDDIPVESSTKNMTKLTEKITFNCTSKPSSSKVVLRSRPYWKAQVT